jgi:hypothetical protein
MQMVGKLAESTETEQEQTVCCHFGFPWLQDLERPDVLKWESGYSSLQDSQAGFEEKCV